MVQSCGVASGWGARAWGDLCGSGTVAVGGGFDWLADPLMHLKIHPPLRELLVWPCRRWLIKPLKPFQWSQWWCKILPVPAMTHQCQLNIKISRETRSSSRSFCWLCLELSHSVRSRNSALHSTTSMHSARWKIWCPRTFGLHLDGKGSLGLMWATGSMSH